MQDPRSKRTAGDGTDIWMPRSRRRSPSLEGDGEPHRVLPARSSRGTRIHKLIGEEAEADASFWGQAVWQEDGEDDDYSTEAEEEDIVDSDFDAEEAPDEDVHDADEDEKPKKRKHGATNSGTYKEPIQSRPAKRNAVAAVQKTPVASLASSTTPVFEYVAPTVRSSTARKSSESSEMRRRASHEAAKLAAKHKKPTVEKTGNRLTQAQLLAEAVRTEVENMQSLQRLEQLEEEKKAEAAAPKAPFTGSMVRYYSKLGAPKTITFVNTLDYPSIFNQPKPKKRISSQQLKLNRLKQEAEEDDNDEDNESVQDDDYEEKDNQQHGLLQSSTPTARAAA
ncbi:Vacuolar protein sorting-associated protein 72 [Phytophthora citrophthora]|uniref:Vacuolar protein sorting-associated protein 72 n=1 Tax=Phytophthora citrophthora TaxID=4793 RepID=A0AAD9GTA9_9STRA|nr:Vacuolar protein sorting-associated protein 72 [Phytophthora citrophthora]